jgi:hypothetical protein
VVGLIPEEKLRLAFYAVEADACEILFLRLIGIHSNRSGVVNAAVNVGVPAGFELCGFEVTDSWWGASPISAWAHSDEDWKELRSTADGHVNEWNTLVSCKMSLSGVLDSHTR